MTERPSIYVHDATSAEEAKEMAKKLPAYRKILEEYPADKWERKFVGVRPMSQTVSSGWFVEFEMRRK